MTVYEVLVEIFLYVVLRAGRANYCSLHHYIILVCKRG